MTNNIATLLHGLIDKPKPSQELQEKVSEIQFSELTDQRQMRFDSLMDAFTDRPVPENKGPTLKEDPVTDQERSIDVQKEATHAPVMEEASPKAQSENAHDSLNVDTNGKEEVGSTEPQRKESVSDGQQNEFQDLNPIKPVDGGAIQLPGFPLVDTSLIVAPEDQNPVPVESVPVENIEIPTMKEMGRVLLEQSLLKGFEVAEQDVAHKLMPTEFPVEVEPDLPGLALSNSFQVIASSEVPVEATTVIVDTAPATDKARVVHNLVTAPVHSPAEALDDNEGETDTLLLNYNESEFPEETVLDDSSKTDLKNLMENDLKIEKIATQIRSEMQPVSAVRAPVANVSEAHILTSTDAKVDAGLTYDKIKEKNLLKNPNAKKLSLQQQLASSKNSHKGKATFNSKLLRHLEIKINDPSGTINVEIAQNDAEIHIRAVVPLDAMQDMRLVEQDLELSLEEHGLSLGSFEMQSRKELEDGASLPEIQEVSTEKPVSTPDRLRSSGQAGRLVSWRI